MLGVEVNFMHRRLDRFGRLARYFVGRRGHHQAAGLAGERQHRVTQGSHRTGKYPDVFFGDALLLGKQRGQCIHVRVRVTPGGCNRALHRLASRV